MLQRVAAACEAVKLATRGEVDILAHPNNVNVRSLVDAVESAHREAGQIETQLNPIDHPNPEEGGTRR